jgi:xanthine dehydrogenase YagR molybdenum-binding subunit
VRLTADRTVRVQIAAQDIGTGAYTIAAQIAADRLGVDLASVQVELGDTNLPPGPIAGGSITTASAGSAVAKACDAVIARLARGSGGAFGINDLSTAFARLGVGAIEEYAEWLPDGAKPESLAKLYAGKTTIVGGPMEDRIMYAFGAEFVEVRVHVRTREVRVPRAVGAFAAGRVINPATARSQLMGGIIWGLSSALHEATEIDRRAASYVNDDLAEYLIPVNADIGDVEVLFVPEEDSRVNPLGAKGLGELGNVGTAAAVCNAVYHATGRRIRDLPLRIEKLL